jgi:hypothetical protein
MITYIIPGFYDNVEEFILERAHTAKVFVLKLPKVSKNQNEICLKKDTLGPKIPTSRRAWTR